MSTYAGEPMVPPRTPFFRLAHGSAHSAAPAGQSPAPPSTRYHAGDLENATARGAGGTDE
jgi:hypothetical protein